VTEERFRPAGAEITVGELARTALYCDAGRMVADLAEWCAFPPGTVDRDPAPWIAAWLRAVADGIDPT